MKVQPKQGRLSEPGHEYIATQHRDLPIWGEHSSLVSVFFTLLQPSGGQQKLQEELKWVLEHHRVRQQALEARE